MPPSAGADYDEDLLVARKTERASRLTAAEQARLDAALAHHAAMDALPADRSVMGAYTLGDMALVEPGCEIWARADVTGAMRLDSDSPDPETEGCTVRGGIVIAVDTQRVVDADTGECRHRRAFACFDYTTDVAHALTTLTETQVDPSRFAAPRADHIRQAYRRICRHVGAQRGVATRRHELDLVAVAAKLAAILTHHSEVRS